jgi:hypothetical protein
LIHEANKDLKTNLTLASDDYALEASKGSIAYPDALTRL